MAETTTTSLQAEPEHPTEQHGWRQLLTWHRLALGGILLIAVFLDFFWLGKNGFGTDYPPAVRSMMDNWHNFFFAAYDPGGFVTIDKPPLGFWLQVISAKIFGFNAVSILVPQALAGVFSVLLLYYLVRRHFGVVAGLLAALVLALTPISVVTNRNITIDSTLTFTLLLGAWAVLRAAESGRLRWLLLSACIVGLGFNIKMLEAYLVVPAYTVLFLLAAPHSIWKRLGHLALAGLLLLVVSFAWVIAVDLTPASQRPQVASTLDNSELSLALGYNGLERLLGIGSTANSPFVTNKNQTQQGGGTQNETPPSQQGKVPTGLFDIGTPGPLRLFDVSLGSQMGWLLPLAVLGILALAWQRRPSVQTVREDRKLQALIFWSMWLLTMGIFFSVAGFFHQYYLTVMAPALAALCGSGLVTMWHDYRRGGWRGWLLPIALVTTVTEQIYLLTAYPAWGRWMIPLIGILGLAAVGVLVSAIVPRLRIRVSNVRLLLSTLGIGVLALLFAPTVWAITPILMSQQADTLLAGPPQQAGGALGGSSIQPSSSLIHYLEANQGRTTALVGVATASDAQWLILATNKPVMPLLSSGISTTSQLATLIKQSKVRFFLLSTAGLQPTGPQSGPTGSPGQTGPQSTQTGSPGQTGSQSTQTGSPPHTGSPSGPTKSQPGPTGSQSDQNASSGAAPSSLITWVTQHCKAVPANLWQSSSAKSSAGNGANLYDCATQH